MAIVLEASDYGGGPTGLVVITLSNITSTSGRLLVLDVINSGTTLDWSIITADGWTQSAAVVGTSCSAGQFYRIDNGSFTGINVDIGSGNGLASIRQFSGNAASGVLDAATYDATNSGSAATTCYSGAASSTADGAAVSMHGWRDDRFVDGGGAHTVNNGFTLHAQIQPEDVGFVTAFPRLDLAFLAYTGSASRSVTSTQYDTGDENIGVIGLYKSAGAGYTHPTLSAAAMGSLTSTGGIPQVHYSFA